MKPILKVSLKPLLKATTVKKCCSKRKQGVKFSELTLLQISLWFYLSAMVACYFPFETLQMWEEVGCMAEETGGIKRKMRYQS